MWPTLAEEFGVGRSFENRSFEFSSKTGQLFISKANCLYQKQGCQLNLR